MYAQLSLKSTAVYNKINLQDIRWKHKLQHGQYPEWHT